MLQNRIDLSLQRQIGFFHNVPRFGHSRNLTSILLNFISSNVPIETSVKSGKNMDAVQDYVLGLVGFTAVQVIFALIMLIMSCVTCCCIKIGSKNQKNSKLRSIARVFAVFTPFILGLVLIFIFGSFSVISVNDQSLALWNKNDSVNYSFVDTTGKFTYILKGMITVFKNLNENCVATSNDFKTYQQSLQNLQQTYEYVASNHTELVISTMELNTDSDFQKILDIINVWSTNITTSKKVINSIVSSVTQYNCSEQEQKGNLDYVEESVQEFHKSIVTFFEKGKRFDIIRTLYFYLTFSWPMFLILLILLCLISYTFCCYCKSVKFMLKVFIVFIFLTLFCLFFFLTWYLVLSEVNADVCISWNELKYDDYNLIFTKLNQSDPMTKKMIEVFKNCSSAKNIPALPSSVTNKNVSDNCPCCTNDWKNHYKYFKEDRDYYLNEVLATEKELFSLDQEALHKLWNMYNNILIDNPNKFDERKVDALKKAFYGFNKTMVDVENHLEKNVLIHESIKQKFNQGLEIIYSLKNYSDFTFIFQNINILYNSVCNVFLKSSFNYTICVLVFILTFLIVVFLLWVFPYIDSKSAVEQLPRESSMSKGIVAEDKY